MQTANVKMEQQHGSLLSILFALLLTNLARLSSVMDAELKHTVIYSIVGGALGWCTHKVLNYVSRLSRVQTFLNNVKQFFKSK